MRFFRIDGDKNEKQLSVKLQDMSIQSAAFRHTSTTSGSNSTSSSKEEVILCGRKPFFYSYDIISGNIAKIPGKWVENTGIYAHFVLVLYILY